LQQTQSARWPVNVTDPSQLAPPDQLRNLSLSTLLDILCSGRPLHEAITAASLGNGSNFGQNGEIPPKLDPLRRISSETFLLQRTRRVAKAIAQLMETLNRPVVHRDALTWRLRGPVGPCALAKAIATESSSPGEAAFLLSEIVLVLQRIDTRKISVGISRKEVDGEISKVIEDLKTMISNRLASGEIPQSMSTYIAAAVRET
jgi:hypothetical protein